MGKGDIKYKTYERATYLTKSLFGQIQLAVQEISASDEPLTDIQLRTLSAYSTELKEKHSEFKANLQKILELYDEEEAPQETLSTDQFEMNKLYIEISSTIEVLTSTGTVANVHNNPNTSQVSVSSNINSQGSHVSHVKLPKLELKHFDGNSIQWVSFINLFNTAIHNNDSISDVTKFQYLLSVLSNEPLNLIKSLNITAPNYKVAYDLLNERYHNTRRLTTLHLNHILDLPSISISSTKPLREFVNLFYEHTQALKALECDISSQPNPLLSALVLRKMDNDLRLKLEVYRSNKTTDKSTSHTLPLIQTIIEFLNAECSQAEDATLHSSSSQSKTNSTSFSHSTHSQKSSSFASKKFNTPRNVAMISTQSQEPKSKGSKGASFTFQPCFACQETTHKIYTCPAFKDKTSQERYQLVKEKQRCVSCLGNHPSKDCRSQSACFTCQQKHHTLLHFDSKQTSPPSQTPEMVNSSNNSQVSLLSSQNKDKLSENCSTVLLGTTLIKLTTPDGNSCVLRALLDSASMCNFISEEAAQLLRSKRMKSELVITGISQNSTHTKGMVNLSLATLSGQVLALQESFHILGKITVDLPRTEISQEVLRKVKHYTLADPSFSQPGKIDVLLGGAIFPNLLTQMTHSLGPNMPYVMGTHFGFVVMGKAPCAPFTHSSNSFHATTLLSVDNFDLHSSLQKFWHLEEPPIVSKKSEEEIVCDKYFQSTHSRDLTGRYTVRLPFKESAAKLGNSSINAQRIFHSLEKKLSLNPQLKKQYTDFMDDYRDSGHMKLCENVPNDSEPHYYLPHHGVFKGEKIRVVFNASSPTSTNISLNQLLHQGPKLQNDIVNIIFNFRIHSFVFTCDIRQMFRQIVIHPDDQKYQLIFWRDKNDTPLQTYQLTTVTYGMTSSPYLAIKTIQQLIEDEGNTHPLATKAIKDQIYVDDILLGSDTLDKALELQKDVISLLASGGFALRKWSSNHESLLQSVPEDHRETPLSLNPEDQQLFNILGMKWISNSDHFSYLVQLPNDTITKRTVLSSIARIYDPCGWISPLVFWAKSLIQRLWILKLDWDDLLPNNIKREWDSFMNELPAVENIRIPRSLSLSPNQAIQILGFCDASEMGFAACVYLRTENSDNTVTTRLLIGKTKVAPLKRVSLPRLELCAAHLLSNLIHHCISLLSSHVQITNVTLWSDSTITLSWIQTPPFRLKTYIANRVSQIQELTQPMAWRHIRSQENPADCASRGIFPQALLEHSLWWNGPSWLQRSPDLWPTSEFKCLNTEDLPEIKLSETVTLVTSTNQNTPLHSLLLKISNWLTLQRTFAYVLRFIQNTKTKPIENRNQQGLSIKELNNSTLKICSLVQQQHFPEEISLIKSNKPCGKRIEKLQPFLDSQGILRVGGRLRHSDLTAEEKHPVILPKSHHVTHILIDFFHLKYLHAGPHILQSLIAKQFWILSARSVIRSRISKCVTCFRCKPKFSTPLMGDLPANRLIPKRAFEICGTDYAGYFNVKIHKVRRIQSVKVYLCIFICFTTKAVHIEVVTDLSADTYIAALTRFVSRRGLPSHIYSDCGTNYTGAASQLTKIWKNFLHDEFTKNAIHRFSTEHSIKFHFSPARAPNFGGLWERCVKSIKHHLSRVIGEQILTLEEFITLSCKVEAILNSRPLTALSPDPTELDILTPGHFLIGCPLTAVPEQDQKGTPSNRLKRWQMLQSFSQNIWKRWKMEYLHTLQTRSKWTSMTTPLKEGDLVIVHEDNSPPLSWKTARITSLSSGQDGIIRVVHLKTKQGVLTRPASKVSVLPIYDSETNSND